jgi:hypothetical protein
MVGITALACFATSAAQAADSASHPSAYFHFKDERVTPKLKPIVIYSAKDLPADSVIDLQRQFGTGHVWENVQKLKAAAGTVTAPAVEMGKYGYRIRVTKGSKVVVTSATHTLYSYGSVPLNAFCNESYVDYCGSPQTVQIGQTIFTYTLEGSNPPDYPTYGDVLEFNSTSCDSITVRFGTSDTTTGDYAYLEVIQERSDPQYGKAPVDTIGKFHATLDGGPFYLEDSETADNPDYMTGSANCYTLTGLP